MTSEVTQELLHKLFSYDPETGILLRKVTTGPKACAGDIAGSLKPKGYLQVKVNYKDYQVHRIIWLYVTGSWPKSHLDHDDRNKANNIWTNLREATCTQNNWNRTAIRDSRSGLKGVTPAGSKWKAGITVNGTYTYLGLHPTPQEAKLAYDREAQKHHGSFFQA